MRHGNFMAVDGEDLRVMEEGWYVNNQRRKPMQNTKFKSQAGHKFGVTEIFKDPFRIE